MSGSEALRAGHTRRRHRRGRYGQIGYAQMIAFRPGAFAGRRSYFYPVGRRRMGYALPTAIGTQIAAPERAAVALIVRLRVFVHRGRFATAVEWACRSWCCCGTMTVSARSAIHDARSSRRSASTRATRIFLALAEPSAAARRGRPACRGPSAIRTALRRLRPDGHRDPRGGRTGLRECVKVTRPARPSRLRYDMPCALTYARGEYSTREALLVKVPPHDPAVFGWGKSAMWGGPHAVTAAVIEREITP